MKTLSKQTGFTETVVKEETNLLKKDPLGIAAMGFHPRWRIPDDAVDEILAVLREEEAVCHE
jgi:hypothetical protein